VFVSSISVFPDDVKPGADESTPVQKLTEPGSEEVRKHYGALKALCEQGGGGGHAPDMPPTCGRG